MHPSTLLHRALPLSLVLALLIPGCGGEPPPDPAFVARTSPWPAGTVLVFAAEMQSAPLDVRVTHGGETTNRTLTFHQQEEVEVTVDATQLRVRTRHHVLDLELEDGRQVSYGTRDGRLLFVRRDPRGRPLVVDENGGSTYGFTGMERFAVLLDAQDGYPTAPVGRGEPGEMGEAAVDPMLGGLVDLDYGAGTVELVGMEVRDGLRGAVLSTYHVLSGAVFGSRRNRSTGTTRVDADEADLLAAGGALGGLRSQMELRGELFRALDPVPFDAEYSYSGEIEMAGDLEHRGEVHNVSIEGPVTVRGSVRLR